MLITLRQRVFPIALLLLIVMTDTATADQAATEKVARILTSFVEDFRSDQAAAKQRVFGIHVPEVGEWCVHVTGKQQDQQWGVELREGPPEVPTFIYRVEQETLEAIDAGTMNAMTAQGKAFSSDYTPLSIVYMEGFAPTLPQAGEINPLSFHFWTRGLPEVIPFRGIRTREAHGSSFGLFYYQPGLRAGWYRVKPGDRVHDGPRERAMPFPILAIATVGVTEGEVAGKRVTLKAGQAVLIPAHADHRWWNDTDEPAEAIVVMFGEGA